MDQVYQFNLKEKTPHKVNPRTDNAGLLELKCVTGAEAVVYLFEGAMSLEECEAAVASSPCPGWKIASSMNESSQLMWSGNSTEFTLYASKAASGYVRIMTFDICS